MRGIGLSPGIGNAEGCDGGQTCALCLYVLPDGATEPRKAETTINGQAVCLDHAAYVQGGSFGVALQLARAHHVGKIHRQS